MALGHVGNGEVHVSIQAVSESTSHVAMVKEVGMADVGAQENRAGDPMDVEPTERLTAVVTQTQSGDSAQSKECVLLSLSPH